MDQLVLEVVQLLDVRQREEFEERAAILEFDAGLSRDMAERAAFAQLCRRGAEN